MFFQFLGLLKAIKNVLLHVMLFGHTNLVNIQLALEYWKYFLILIFSFFSEHKICIVGLDNAGKTTILYQVTILKMCNPVKLWRITQPRLAIQKIFDIRPLFGVE